MWSLDWKLELRGRSARMEALGTLGLHNRKQVVLSSVVGGGRREEGGAGNTEWAGFWEDGTQPPRLLPESKSIR